MPHPPFLLARHRREGGLALSSLLQSSLPRLALTKKERRNPPTTQLSDFPRSSQQFLYYPFWRNHHAQLSNLEIFAFIASLFVLFATWIPWYRRAATINPLSLFPRIRLGFYIAPIVCLLFTLAILLTLGDKDVRRDPVYLTLYLTLTTACLGITTRIFPLLGLSPREDVLERANQAAFIAVCAALFGAAAAFAGANIGNGPGIEVVLFTALLLAAIFLGSWFAVERLTSISQAVTVDRNRHAGIRLAGFLLALGILTGWIGAGDWISYRATLRDALVSLPAVLVLCSAFAYTESHFKKRKLAPSRESFLSLVSALLFVVLTCAWLTLRGIL